MTKPHTPLWRKYGKMVFKVLDKKWIKEIPLIEEERKKDRFTTEEIKKRVIKAAVGRERTIEEERIRRRVEKKEGEPTSQTIIRRIKRVKGVEEITTGVNKLLKEQFYSLKGKLKGKTICIAVDAHDEPYYGVKTDWTCGGRRKQSTTTFTRVIAMYLVHPGRPILLAVSPMEQSEGNTVLKMMRELLRWLNEKNYPFRRVILLGDGKYCHGPLLSFLSTHNVDYIVRAYPSKISKKLGAELVENKLINHGRSFAYSIYSNLSGFFHTREIVYLSNEGLNVYATSLPFSVNRVVLIYRRRFRIENSFRDMRFLLLRTCSRDPRVRYTLLYLALLLHHLLHYMLFLTLSSSILTLHHFVPCPFPQRLFFSSLSSFLESNPHSSKGGEQ
ncbi:MAG: transposase [Candidatus Heimdallarchaeaceae archaeon]